MILVIKKASQVYFTYNQFLLKGSILKEAPIPSEQGSIEDDQI